ncbi:MAG: ABC transporter permease, partial [Planctomycetota bacterium]
MPEGSTICSSFVSIQALAAAELKAVLRSHPFRIFVPAAAVFVVGAPSLVHMAFEERGAMVAQVGVSTAALFSTLLALLAGAGSMARDREGGLRDLLLSRPLEPGTYLVGKWLGITAAAALSVTVLGGVHLVSVALRGGAIHGYGPLVAALLVAAVQGGLAAAVALAFSARLRAGPAFLAALVFLLLGHAAALLPAGTA